MKISYSKTEINKLKYSGLFLLFLMLLCVYFMIRDKEITVLIVSGPVIVALIAKLIQLFVFLFRYKKQGDFYLELKENTLIYRSIFDGKLHIDLAHIKDIQMDKEGLLLYMDYSLENNKKHKLSSLIKYYIPDLQNVYKIPILAEKEKIEMIFEVIKEKIISCPVQEDMDKLVNLCGRYIYILVGILWSFELHVIGDGNLQQNVFKLLFLGVVMCYIHMVDKKPLYHNGVSFGVLIRCIGCSLIIAQYILCACQIEEIVKGICMNLSVSRQNFIILSAVYVAIFILFFPSKGLGRRVTLYYLKRNKRNEDVSL